MSTRDDRTRVVHVTGCLDVGGQEKLLVEFARHADRDRFALHFVSLGGRGPVADELEALGWTVTALDMPAGLRPGMVVRLARLFRRLGADVVHTHNDRPLIYAAPAGRLARAAVVHTKHGRAPGNTRRQRFLTKCAARLTDHFVGVSDDCSRLAIEQGVPTDRVRTLCNGIDTQRFAFTGPRGDGPAVIVARLCPEKDLATLLRATALVVRGASDFRLHVAGDGPCRTELQALTSDLGLHDRVTFLGLVHDVPALLRTARLYVLSSVSEGISLTLLEAMACGLPVVATRVGGTPEVVADGGTGLLVPPKDPAALAEAMLQVWRDPARAAAFGRAGRERVEQAFDVRRMVARYEELYAEDRHDALDQRDVPGAGGRRAARPEVGATPRR